ncbi:hypothetical protein ACFSC6_12415 [Rufibacter sediminis]|uniref:Transmembrane protein n=1 Tax=Rufibacter sediminis TaxID=2762756 RepID=A0ABR6VU59_9BACT|nr:hypothetical protein [Rufibacter sediminis]MBC3540685.1 hypothetical protein [Rufibacter sediminis]
METLSNHRPSFPHAFRPRKFQVPFAFGYAFLLLCFFCGVFYLSRPSILADQALGVISQEAASPDYSASAPAMNAEVVYLRETEEARGADSSNSHPVARTTADLEHHPMFAPLQQQLPDSMPLIFRPEAWQNRK